MWCPKCKSEYREGITECPVCKTPLAETLETDGEGDGERAEQALLMAFQDRDELNLTTGLLDAAGIPYLLREPGGGEVLRITTGSNLMGTEIYVDSRCLRYALQLVRQVQGDGETEGSFDEDALNKAIDEFETEYPEEAAEKDDPVTPEGYRIALIFLAVFGTAALLAILIPLLRSLALP